MLVPTENSLERTEAEILDVSIASKGGQLSKGNYNPSELPPLVSTEAIIRSVLNLRANTRLSEIAIEEEARVQTFGDILVSIIHPRIRMMKIGDILDENFEHGYDIDHSDVTFTSNVLIASMVAFGEDDYGREEIDSDNDDYEEDYASEEEYEACEDYEPQYFESDELEEEEPPRKRRRSCFEGCAYESFGISINDDIPQDETTSSSECTVDHVQWNGSETANLAGQQEWRSVEG